MLKKMFLSFVSVASLSMCACESVEFTPKIVTWTYEVKAKNAEQLSDILAMQTRTQETISDMKRGVSGASFANLLTFIKELQEAIFAGLNLFGVANINQQVVTQQELALINAVENVVQSAEAEQAQEQSQIKRSADVDSEIIALCEAQEAVQVEQATAEQQETSEEAEVVDVQSVVPSIKIQIVFTMLKPEDMQQFQVAIEILNKLTEALNQQMLTAQDLVTSLQEVSAVLQSSDSGAYFTLQG